MIPVLKKSPLAVGYRVTSRKPPEVELAVIVRGKFELHPFRPLALVRTELDAFGADAPLDEKSRRELRDAGYVLGQGNLGHDAYESWDAERVGQLVYPSDFAEWKPKADVMLRASCHPPGGGATECTVGFGVGNFYKELRVVGPRAWIDKVLGGAATEPLAFKKLPVDWEHAFGGPGVPDNPVGRGFDGPRGNELPTVEDPKRPVSRASQAPKPAGFGPVNPGWPLRKDKLGKDYGKAWEKERAPWYALDYDWTAQNAAPADQQLDGFLRGDEEVRFVGLHPEARDFTRTLPGLLPRVFVKMKNGESREVLVSCDTLFADLDAGHLYLTWRGHTPVAEDDLSDVGFLYLAHDERGARTPARAHLEALDAFAANPLGLERSPATALAALEERIDNGALDAELAGASAEKAVETVFGPLLARTEGGAERLEALRRAVASVVNAGPNRTEGPTGVPGPPSKRERAFTAGLVGALKEATSGAQAPLLFFTAKGEVVANPFLRKIAVARDAAKAAARAAGEDEAAVDGQIRRVLADIPGWNPDPAKLPAAPGVPPAPEPGADFSGFDMSGCDFSGKDLSGANFEAATLRGTNFTGAKLAGARFRGASLGRALLVEADCKGADFSVAALTRVDARKACFDGAVFEMTTLLRSDLREATFRGARAVMAQLQGCELAGADFARARCEKCVWNECRARGALFEGAVLARSFLRECDLERAVLDRADVGGASFFRCAMARVSLQAATGKHTSFQYSTLDDARLAGVALPESLFLGVSALRANLRSAELTGARFYRAGLRGANLDRANLLRADLRKTVLTDAMLTGVNAYQAIFMEAFGNDADFRGANLEQANFRKSRLVMKP